MKRAQYVSTILLAGLAALGVVYFVQQLDFNDLPFEEMINEEIEEIVSGEEDDSESLDILEEVDAGEYLIYKTKKLSFEGKEDWGNDDIWDISFYRIKVGDEEPVLFKTLQETLDLGGSIVPQIYGKDLLVHRYAKDQDAIISLAGEEEIVASSWGTIRSEDGGFQVDFTSVYDAGEKDSFTLTNTARKDELESEVYLYADIDERLVDRQAVPYHISNYGDLIAFAPTDGPMEGFFQGTTFLYHHDSGKVLDLSENADLENILKEEGLGENSSKTSKKSHWSYIPESQKIWLTIFETTPDEDQVYTGWRSTAPFKIYEIDVFEKEDPRVIIEDDTFLIENVQFNEDKSLMHYSINGDSVWIAPVGAVRENEHRITSGRLQGWLSDGIVVDRGVGGGSDVVYIDLDSRNITPLGRTVGAYGDEDYINFEYIGSIEIE